MPSAGVSKREPAVPGALAVLLGMTFCCLTGCGALGTTGSGKDDFGMIGGDMKGEDRDLRGLPSVRDLPPVIPEASGRFSAAEVTGPHKPRIAWALSLPFSQSGTIQAIAADGTVYVAGGDGVGAARDGKLMWAYRTERPPNVTMADDGRIWFGSIAVGGYFCLNRAGEGGMLPYSVPLPPDAAQPAMLGCSGNGRYLRGLPSGDVPLEYGCTRPKAKTGPDGMTYVGTTAPDIRAVGRDGTVAWKLTTPCSVETLLAGPGGRVFFSCKDLSMHYIQNGSATWDKAGDGAIDEVGKIVPNTSIVSAMDRDGTIYFIDHPPAQLPAHVHAITASGEMLWTLKTSYFNGTSMQFDKQGRIIMTAMRGMHNWLVCISN